MPQKCFESKNVENSYVNFIESLENNLNLNFKDITRETRRNTILSKVSDLVLQGSLINCNDDNLSPFREKYTQLSVEHGCI